MLTEDINPHLLSEILKNQLKNHGIKTKFHIGLFSNNRLVVKEKGIEIFVVEQVADLSVVIHQDIRLNSKTKPKSGNI